MQAGVEILKNRALDIQKEPTTKFHLCRIFLCPTAFHLSLGNSHNNPEGKKLIGSIYHINNNYPLMDRAYESGQTLTLGKNCGFHTVIHPKKNRKLPWLYDKQL